MEENKLDFFGDIKDKLILLAVGLVSMATIVPLFINNVHKIFHISIEISYSIFTVVYFILPLLFFILYYFSVNQGADLRNMGRESKKEMKVFFIVVVVAMIIYFVYPGIGYSKVGAVAWSVYTAIIDIMILLFLGRVLYLAFIEGKREIQKNPAKKTCFTEFRVIGCVVMVLFVALYVTNLPQITKWLFSSESNRAAGSSFDYYRYAKDLDTLSSKFDELESSSHKNLSVASLYQDMYRTTANTRRIQRLLIIPYSRYTPKEIMREDSLLKAMLVEGADRKQLAAQLKQDTTFGPLIARLSWLDDHNNYSSIFKTYFALIKNYQLGKSVHPDSSNFDLNYSLFRQSYYMKDYINGIDADANSAAKEKWVILLKQLKYKGLVWLLFLIMLSLYWWLHLSYQLADQQTKQYPLASPTEDINTNTKSISQVKSFIYILFLLVLPFFKHIDKNDINLDKPFLNFGVNSLSPEPPLPENKSASSSSSGANGDDLRETNRLLQHIDNDIEEMNAAPAYVAPRFDSLNNQVNDLGRQTIRYSRSLKNFLHDHPDKPIKK